MIYADIYDGPARNHGGRTDKRYVVIHCTQNDASAAGEASYAKRRTDGVSSHYYVDGRQILQSLDTDLRAHHVGSRIGNDASISYEITGMIGWSRRRWLDSVAWELLARQIAVDCVEHDIDPRLLSVAEIKRGDRTGIITHDEARRAWGHTTHTDPGPNFPMDHLLAQVQQEMEDDMPSAKEIAREVWRGFRNLDYVNKDKSSKDHQVARAHEYSYEARNRLRESLPKIGEQLEAIAAAVGGESHAEVLERIDAHHAEQMAAIAVQDEALAQAVAEREELAELVRRRDELGADAVVDELVRRLTDDG